jgi:putative peptidoglycan lipid II flippase
MGTRVSQPDPTVKPSIARAGGIMFVSLLLSRVLGIFRDTVMAAKFGVGADTDAYRLAFQIPDLIFFAVAGGALSSAFIPIFSEYLHTDREDEAWKLFSIVATIMSIVVIVFIVLAWIFAYPLAQVIAPGKDPALWEPIAQMSRIVLPAQFAFFVGGLMFGTLYAKQKFAVPGLGPNIYNLGIISGALIIAPMFGVGIAGMSWGALIGAIIGSFLIPLYAMTKVGAKFTPSVDVSHPGVKKVFKLMLPVVLGLSLPGVYGLIMQGFGSFYEDGVNTALDLGNKLMQAPLGIFGQSLALAIFPFLAKSFAEQQMGRFQAEIGSTLRTVLYVTLPVSVLMAVLAPEIVTFFFQYGKARDANLPAVVDCLRMFSIGIWAWCLHPVLMRGFFATQRSATPIVLGTITTAIFIALSFGLKGTGLGYLSLPLASSVSAIVLAVMMLFAMKSAIGGLDVNGIVTTFAKSAVASLAMGAVVYGAVLLIPDGAGLGQNVMAALKLGIIGIGGGWIYYFLTTKMAMPERSYIQRALARFDRKPSSHN